MHQGTHRPSGTDVAIKALKAAKPAEQREVALHEAYVLDRCRGEPNIVQLLDVFLSAPPKPCWHLVFELSGTDLHAFLRLRACGLSPAEVRSVAEQFTRGLRHIHGLGLVHADVKPANILVKVLPCGFVAAKLADVGSALAANPDHRALDSPQEVLASGVPVQTLGYRAPEILFGDTRFGVAADSWSVGMTVVQLGGCDFWKGFLGTSPTAVSYMMHLYRQLGTPTAASLLNLPLWPRSPPAFRRQEWPAALRSILGAPGIDWVDSLLRWAPEDRSLITHACSYLSPQKLQLAGELAKTPAASSLTPSGEVVAASSSASDLVAATSQGPAVWQGQRHPWNMLAGCMAPEVLAWLRADPALSPGTPEFAELGLMFEGERKGAKTEEGRKFILSGFVGSACSSVSMCGISVATPLPLPRLQTWLRAWRHVNAEIGFEIVGPQAAPGDVVIVVVVVVVVVVISVRGFAGSSPWWGPLFPFVEDRIGAMVGEAKVAARRLSEETKAAANFTHFFETPVQEWLLTCGMLMISTVAAMPGTHAVADVASQPAAGGSDVASKPAAPAPKKKAAGKSKGKVASVSSSAASAQSSTAAVASSPSSAASMPPSAASALTAPGYWEEELHLDGGGSVLHMGVTYFGRRVVRNEQNGEGPDVLLQNVPGTVYLGELTGPWHQAGQRK